jgi:hypothetical protein
VLNAARACFATAILAASVFDARRALATPTSKLTYVRSSGAEVCPAEPVLRRAVAERVGYDPFFPWAQRTVAVQIDPAGAKGFASQLRILDADGTLLGERLLEPVHDCGELVQSIALAISVAIDDIDVASMPSPDAPTRPFVAAPAPSLDLGKRETEGSREEPPLSSSRKPAQWKLRFSLGPSVAIGTAPAPAVGVVVGAAVRSSWLHVGLEGRADALAEKPLSPVGTASTSLLLASVVPCVVVAGTVTPFACGVASLGRFEASAENVVGPTNATAPYVSLGGRVGLEIAVAGWLAAYAQLDLGAPLTRHRTLLGKTEVFKLPAAAGAAGAGAAVFF